MTINSPSRQWVSQRLAILESIANLLERRINLLCIPYFLALGFLMQGWLKANVGASVGLSAFDTVVLPFSLVVLAVLGPVLLTLAYLVKAVTKRL